MNRRNLFRSLAAVLALPFLSRRAEPAEESIILDWTTGYASHPGFQPLKFGDAAAVISLDGFVFESPDVLRVETGVNGVIVLLTRDSAGQVEIDAHTWEVRRRQLRGHVRVMPREDFRV